MEKSVSEGGRGGGEVSFELHLFQTPPRVASPPLHPGSSKELPTSPLLCLPLETDSMDCMHDIPAVWVAQPFFNSVSNSTQGSRSPAARGSLHLHGSITPKQELGSGGVCVCVVGGRGDSLNDSKSLTITHISTIRSGSCA